MAKLSTAEILSKRKPNRKSTPILLEPDLKAEIEKTIADITVEEQRKRKDKSLADTDVTALKEKLVDLYTQAESHTVHFTFQDIGRKPFVDLMKAHRPTEETLQMFDELGEGRPEFEPDTFAPALIAAASFDPLITPEEAEAICASWSEGDIEALFMTAYTACRERTSIPFSEAGIAQNGSIEPSSTTGSVTGLDGKDGTETSTK